MTRNQKPEVLRAASHDATVSSLYWGKPYHSEGWRGGSGPPTTASLRLRVTDTETFSGSHVAVTGRLSRWPSLSQAHWLACSLWVWDKPCLYIPTTLWNLYNTIFSTINVILLKISMQSIGQAVSKNWDQNSDSFLYNMYHNISFLSFANISLQETVS